MTHMDPSELLKTAGRYHLSQAIYAAAALGVADHLVGAERSAAELATALGVDAEYPRCSPPWKANRRGHPMPFQRTSPRGSGMGGPEQEESSRQDHQHKTSCQDHRALFSGSDSQTADAVVGGGGVPTRIATIPRMQLITDATTVSAHPPTVTGPGSYFCPSPDPSAGPSSSPNPARRARTIASERLLTSRLLKILEWFLKVSGRMKRRRAMIGFGSP